MRQVRTELRKQAKIKRHEKAVELQMALEDRAAARRLLEELAELARGSRRWGARFKVQDRPKTPDRRTSPVTKRSTLSPLKAPRTPAGEMRPGSSWVVDELGMRGIIWQQSYLGRKSVNFYRGAARDNWKYIVRDEAVLLDAAGEPIILSNMGEDWIEIGTAWQVIEDASTRKNAKIQILVIAPFDSDMSQEEMVAALRHFCTTVLEPLGLPYAATIHAPPEHGDERNFHPHITFSLRPTRRVEAYCWDVADEVCGELDGRDGVQMLRHLWAHSMSEAAEQANRTIAYTGLGYGARGLDLEAGTHLGEGLSAIVAGGGHVWAHERNRIKNARNAARRRMRDLDHKIAALIKVRDAAIARREAAQRSAVAPGRRFVVSTAIEPAEARVTGKPVARAKARVMSSSVPPSTRTVRSIAPTMRTPVVRSMPIARAVMRHVSVSGAGSPAVAIRSVSARTPPSLVHTVSEITRKAPPPMTVSQAPGAVKSRGRSVAPTLIKSAASTTTRSRPARASAPKAEGTVVVDRVDRRPSATVAPAPKHAASTARPEAASNPIVTQAETMLAAIRQARKKAQVSQRGPAQRSDDLPTPLAAAVAELPERPGAEHVLQGATSRPDPRQATAGASSIPPNPLAADKAARWRAHRILAADDRITSATVLSSRAWLECHARQVWSDQAASVVSRRRHSDSVEPVDAPAADLRHESSNSGAAAEKVSAVAAELGRSADAAAAQAADEQRGREHRRYLRFLALVALHPDWFEQGELGLAVAAHAPAEMVDQYAVWQNDHERQRSVAHVRQAALDGIHRLPPDLAADVAKTIDTITPRLPPPPPLRNAHGKPSTVAELAMALVADHPHWLPAAEPIRLSTDASPALTMIVARYEQDRTLPRLLAAARQYGEGATSALESEVARRVDNRRLDCSIRQAAGALRALAPDKRSLSPAMVEHLALARRHPEWIVRDRHVGLGLGADASPLFREQWANWNEPVLARQLLLDTLSPDTTSLALTPAMSAQIVQRLQAIDGRTRSSSPARVIRDQGLDR